MIKAGLVLAAFANNLNVLLIGEPGLGKTSLLKSLNAFSTNAIYTNAKTQKVGITVKNDKKIGHASC